MIDTTKLRELARVRLALLARGQSVVIEYATISA